MNAFFQGMRYLLLGFRNLRTRGLKRFIILPVMFNCLLFAGLFYIINHYVLIYAYDYIAKLPSWLSFLSWVFFIIFILSFIIVFLLLFTVMFNLIAAPINGLLAEKTQKILYHRAAPPQSFMQMALRTMQRQGQYLAYFLPRLLGMGILFFVPFIQPIYPILWFFFAAWMLSVQYQDFAMDNNLINFKEMIKKIKANRLQALGFGSLINLMSFIPGLNLLVIPAAVIGSVMLYCEQNK